MLLNALRLLKRGLVAAGFIDKRSPKKAGIDQGDGVGLLLCAALPIQGGLLRQLFPHAAEAAVRQSQTDVGTSLRPIPVELRLSCSVKSLV